MSLFPKFKIEPLPAKPAKPAKPGSNFSDFSNFSRGGESPIDPASATEPFNQHAMDAIKAGQAVSVWSDFLGEWLYWVRGEKERQRLRAEGCRVQIYTLGELAVVVRMSREDLKKIHQLKATFNGIIKSN